MRKLITAAIVAAYAFLANAACATPVSEYQLVVDSCTVRPSDPYAPPGSGCNASTLSELADTTLAMSSGAASFEYTQIYKDIEHVSVLGSGFVEIDVPSDTGMARLYPNPAGRSLCAIDCDLKVSAFSDGLSLLEASMSIHTGTFDFMLSGDKGYFASDFLSLGGDFTGHFELVATTTVPEPSTLPLAMIACLTVFGLRRRAR